MFESVNIPRDVRRGAAAGVCTMKRTSMLSIAAVVQIPCDDGDSTAAAVVQQAADEEAAVEPLHCG